MAVQAIALFDRAVAIDGAARRASMLDRCHDGRFARRVGDSSASTGLNGKMQFSGRRGRTRPAAGRGVDGVDDRSGYRREVYEYPFGRVSPENRVVPSETAPSAVSHAARADRGDGSRTRASRARWEQTGPGQWSATASSYSRMYWGPTHANDVPPPPPGLPPSRRRLRDRGNRALHASSRGEPLSGSPGENGPFATRRRRNGERSPALVAGALVALAAFAVDLPGATARLARERRAHRAVASLTAETTNPESRAGAIRAAHPTRVFTRVVTGGDVLDVLDALADARPERVMGHFRAREAPRRTLRLVEKHGDVLLRAPAARAFASMRARASRDGVFLTPVSGFRDVDKQRALFFDGAADRGQSLQKRALVSAPPGFSEHHTGYALDISCPEVADDLVVAFERTESFAWLARNAHAYGFELSFGRDDASSPGVSYEPWHWRWVGNAHSRETFARAREAVGKA